MAWPVAILAGLLALIWVSPEPFKTSSSIQGQAGNVLNQIAFSLGAIIAIAASRMGDARAAAAFLRPSYLLLIGWLAVCIVLSISPDVSLRAFLFTLVVLSIAAFGMTLPRGERQFALALGLAALITLAFCYFGLAAFPDSALHSADDIAEPEHAGAWRGVFDHKNIAGPMMASFTMIGLYVAAAASALLGWTVILLSLLFFAMTGAKTSLAVFPVTLALVFVAERISNPLMRALWCLAPVLLLLTATVGSVMLPPVKELLDLISPGQTYTGRAELWQFVLDRIGERPITGFGFEAFWGSELVRNAERGETDTGLAQGMVHGHNSYLDMAVSIGLPGLALCVAVLLILPLADYEKARRFAENRLIARLCLRLWLYGVLIACLESFFFRRADPVWFTLILAVMGLRLISLWRVTR